MKPLTIKVGTLVKVGLGVAAVNAAYFIGKGDMLSTVEKVNPETAGKILKAMDEALDSKTRPMLDKLKLKIVKGTYKIKPKEK